MVYNISYNNYASVLKFLNFVPNLVIVHLPKIENVILFILKPISHYISASPIKIIVTWFKRNVLVALAISVKETGWHKLDTTIILRMAEQKLRA